MKTLSIEQVEAKKSRIRNSVHLKLETFINANIATIKANTEKKLATNINVKEDLKCNESEHYYNSLKMLRAKFSDKLKFSFNHDKENTANYTSIDVYCIA